MENPNVYPSSKESVSILGLVPIGAVLVYIVSKYLMHLKETPTCSRIYVTQIKQKRA